MEVDEPIEELSRTNEPLYVAHQKDFVGLLPVEVWTSILSLLGSSDKQNAANSSPFFWEILKDERVFFLLPDVFSVLASKYEGRKYSVEKLQKNGELVDINTGKSHAELMNDLGRQPGILVAAARPNDLLWKPEVQKCRFVCKEWKNGVDEAYQKPHMQGISEFVKDIDPTSMLNTMSLNWHKSYMINETYRVATRRFLDTGTPFPFKHLVITHMPSTIPCNQRYFDQLIEMLRVFGNQLKYCHIKLLTVDYGCARRNRSKFLEFLSLMPNLEYLNIERLTLTLPDDRFGDEPVPRFENLKVLKLGKDEPEVATDLLAANNHIKSLVLHSTDSRDLVLFDFPNLTSFKSEGSLTANRMLENIGDRWKLEKLKVSKLIMGTPAELFRLLEMNWATTLVDVDLPDGILDGEQINVQLNLPNVKRFTLTSSGGMLDFMLPMKKLEHFEIRTVYESPKDSLKSHRIQLNGYEDRMQDSNIWDYFPKLKTIKLHDARKCLDLRPRFRLYTNKREKYVYYGSE